MSGSIAQVGERDDYTLDATAGQIVYLDATGDCVDGVSWRLLTPTGGLQDIAASCRDIGREVLKDAGTWTVEVSSDTTATGDYAFTLYPVAPLTTTPVSVGQPVSGSIATIGEWHDYTLDATAGQIVYLDATGDCVDGVSWRLLTPTGGLQDIAASCRDIGREVLKDAGTWTVEVSSDTTATGDYAFTLYPVAPLTTTPVSVGQPVSGSIATIGEWHRLHPRRHGRPDRLPGCDWGLRRRRELAAADPDRRASGHRRQLPRHRA